MGPLIVAEVRLTIRVKPGSSRAKVGGNHDGALIVAVNAQPVDGAANEAVIAALADALGVKRRQLRILSGHANRNKILRIDTDEPGQVEQRISQLTSA